MKIKVEQRTELPAFNAVPQRNVGLFHFCVRNGNRWFQATMAAHVFENKSFVYKYSYPPNYKAYQTFKKPIALLKNQVAPKKFKYL